MRHSLLILLLTSPLLAASSVPVLAVSTSPSGQVVAAPVEHSAFDRLLKKHVNAQGLVNYKSFNTDGKEFNQYRTALGKNAPAAWRSTPGQMAYWSNACKAYMIRLIQDHYPVKSIKDSGFNIKIPFVTPPGAAEFSSIGGKKMRPDDIEHGTPRKKCGDPPVPSALVCASSSRPRLRNEAYTATQLDQQLNKQGRDFLSCTSQHKVGKDAAQLSMYFDSYKGGWNTNGQSVVRWVNRYSPPTMANTAKITVLDYNRQLNEQ
ncbi:DUF547 domain-containing protein [Hymenobacter glacieicola]|nr:DUF547 domain-containing protein [Hymenobacter glacieicola]